MRREQKVDLPSTRLVRLLKAEAYNSNSLQWHAATAIQQHATRHRLVPSQSQANQSTYGQSTLGQWSLTSHARIETVEEEDEKVDDATQPESSNNLSDLDTTPYGPSEMEYERSESVENTVRQNTKPLDAVELSDPKCDATLHHILKPNDSPTPKLKMPAIHIILSEPPSGLLFGPYIFYRLTLPPQRRNTMSKRISILLMKDLPTLRGLASNH